MSDERRVKERRAVDRRRGERRKPKLPVPVAGPPSPPLPEDGAAAFTAQLIGQGGEKRGLKGGKPVLDKARHAYVEAEWTGPNDRRLKAGKIAKTEV